MVPMSIFRSAQFSATNVVTFLLYGAFAAALFMLGLVLQGPLDYSPLLAGAATVPLTIMMLLFSARAGAIAQRIGPRIPMTIGPLLCAAGFALLTRVEPGRSYVSGVLPGILVFATGLTLTVAPLTTTALSSVAAHLAGVASGVNNAVARTGSLVAVAAIPVVAGFTAGAAVDDATLLDGYGKVLWASVGVAVAAGIVSAVWVRRIEPEVTSTGAATVQLCGVEPTSRGERHRLTQPPIRCPCTPQNPTGAPRHTGPMRISVDPSTDPADYPFRHRIRVRFAETDAMQIVHHGRYLPYLEEGRVAYLRHIGHPYTEWREQGTDSAVLEAYVRYIKPLRFDDEFDVHIDLADVTRTTFQMSYLLTRGDDVCATAVTAHGLLNAAGRPIRLPAWLVSSRLNPARST